MKTCTNIIKSLLLLITLLTAIYIFQGKLPAEAQSEAVENAELHNENVEAGIGLGSTARST